ncbi:MAG: hypothetical protein ACPGOV_17360 [Magnetovibrionaceae bacterium]
MSTKNLSIAEPVADVEGTENAEATTTKTARLNAATQRPLEQQAPASFSGLPKVVRR